MTGVAEIAGILGSTFGLVGFRRPERALAETLKQALPSFAAGTVLGAALLLFESEG